MQFDSLVGQLKAKTALRQMTGSNRMPHALLFLGPPGCGKLAMAVAFAQYILCEDPSDSDSCGNCKACRKSARLIHPDLHFSYPTVGTNVISDSLLDQLINHWLKRLDHLVDNHYLKYSRIIHNLLK